MKILVGNLTPDVSPDFLQQTFQVYGTISSVSINVDSTTNEAIGEVEMPDAHEALTAVASLDGNRIEGRVISINNKSEIMNNESPQQNSAESTGDDSFTDNRINDERRVIDSPLFKADKGIVIDRRDYTDRRGDPDTQNNNDPPLEAV